MKKGAQFLQMFPVLLLAVLATPLFAQTDALTGTDRELRALAQAWQDAYNRGDVQTLGSMYADNVAMVNPADGSLTTLKKEDIVAGFEKDFSELDSKIEILVDQVATQRDGTAIVSGSFTQVDVNKKTGAKQTVSATYSHVCAQDAGKWKLVKMQVTPR
ncbi:MAG: nuclear transport factor 2 family protein [Saprospiraceae bacterium]|nr:nuclear transport factor 2 family protein [Saprospiraceae bacterium]